MIIDTHCHYNLEPLFADWQTHWQKAQAEGIIASIVVGTDVETSQRAVSIADETKELFASIGFHPYEYVEPSLDDTKCLPNIQDIRSITSKKIVAIGETGLDYFRFQDYTTAQIEHIQKIQQFGLREHLQLATERALPVILHVRDTGEAAYVDVLRILKEENYQGKFILHCVSGPTSYIEHALELGAYISAAGNMSYATAHHLREIVKMTPADKLLLETDAPFLPPVPHRGKQCEPWMIRLTAEYLEKELQISLDQCLQNTYTLFPQLKNLKDS